MIPSEKRPWIELQLKKLFTYFNKDVNRYEVALQKQQETLQINSNN